ncbi:LOW QUALITY PROTEIN: amyloid beta A4 precursor protein-binding family B member 1-interacting protein [Tachyglossus aculeatus]|uniref:LOW QUALITY PROTEIN: amyloid beta A4 precursor protein-binding family B member 1-interacting protein n=1 Tax=Tachyglossus aculeatus TaxID=9261 RepID=UPI0018F41E2C|nr:LOW QUALITY PROTEIN: amyloid beta A4 precursor protein-binding family B member 1-interacting protein [Tachyglossus aculeatus]
MAETSEDIEQMFSNLLGEMDLLTQSLGVETLPPPPKPPNTEFTYSVGFKDLSESLNALEDKDLDALMADLVADISEAEQRTIEAQKKSAPGQPSAASQPRPDLSVAASLSCKPYVAASESSLYYEDDLPPPPADPIFDLPPPPPEPLSKEDEEAQAKSDKIKLALEKLKEAKVKKLVVKVHMNDNSTKSLMLDERQTARDVLDNLFEKTHCNCNVEWCLYETYPELQIERFFEDHENVVEILTDWTRDTENKVLFLEKDEKYAVFKNPQNFLLANKGKKEGKDPNEKMNPKNKEALLEESFCGTSVIVPELEGALYLKEDGKKYWKRRYFLLRASGIYYVPKGKTKTSRDLTCFIQFENVNVYYGTQYKVKYKAPTDHCFVLKHPQIQKESQYIKYLCCDDSWTLNQWVTGIRIAKYGKTLYDNYQRAVEKAGLAARWSNLGTGDPAATTDVPSELVKSKGPTQHLLLQRLLVRGHSNRPLARVECEGQSPRQVNKMLSPPPLLPPTEAVPVFSVPRNHFQYNLWVSGDLWCSRRQQRSLTYFLCHPRESAKEFASTGPGQPNGQIPQTTHPVSSVLQDAQKDFSMAKEPNVAGDCNPPAPTVKHSKKSALLPPPPPQRRSSDTSSVPSVPSKPQNAGTGNRSSLEDFPLPPPLLEDELPPPPPDFIDDPPSFVPPPPPSLTVGGLHSSPPPPPPPPPAASREKLAPLTKRPPAPPKRHDHAGQAGEPNKGPSGEADFMSDLMKALQKKRGNVS